MPTSTRRDQHSAGRMRHDLAHHLAHQQVGQQAAPSAPANHDQVGGALACLLDDLGECFRPVPHAKIELYSIGLRARHETLALDGRFGIGLGRELRCHRLELGVAHHRQHARQRQCAPARERERQRLGTGVEFAVLGGQQQVREGASHAVNDLR
jgi:hypothetical protein